MSRKCIPRLLPDPEDVFGFFLGFPEETAKQHVLLNELRKAAKRLRKRTSRPFYSMRTIANYFKVPLRTVAIAYETLESEGLFNRIRSSQTMLVGTMESTSKIVRGVVGIPIWLHAIVVSPFSRIYNTELEERLRKSGFIADFIFFRTGEDCQPDFAERLLRHNLNFVIWHTPQPLSSHVLLSLQDHGVRQITIQMMEAMMSAPPPNYLLNWQPAYQVLAKAWRDLAIDRVLIPSPTHLSSQRGLLNFSRVFEENGIETELTKPNAATLLEKTEYRHSTAVAFMDQQGADTLCNDDPVTIDQIIRNSRVAFCRGPMYIPYFRNRPTQADIIGFSPVEMAERIVNDLCQQATQSVDGPHVFEAIYHPRQSLNQFCGVL